MRPCHRSIRVTSWGLNGLKGGNAAHDFTRRGDLNTKRLINQLPTTPFLPPPPISTSFQAQCPLLSLPFSLDLFLFIFDPGLVCSSSPFNPGRCILWVINHRRVFRYFAAAADFPVNVSRGVDRICILQSAFVCVKSSLESRGRMAARAY